MGKIVFNCSSCDKRLSVDANEVGLKARCPSCNSIIEIPSPILDIDSSQSKDRKKRRLSIQVSNRLYLFASIGISLLWALIREIFFTDDGLIYLQSALPYFILNVTLLTFGLFVVISLFSVTIVWLTKLLDKSKRPCRFTKTLFFSNLVLSILSILGAIETKDEKNSHDYASETPAESKLQLSEEKIGIEKLGVSDFYRSSLDSFACSFPTNPILRSARSSNSLFRSYQASEIIQDGFIFYSVTVTINDSNLLFDLSSENSRKLLTSILDEFRFSLSSVPSKDFSSHFGIFLDRYAIEYSIDFQQDGVECVNQGIFLLESHRIIRISLSHSKNITHLIPSKYSKFKSSFGLIH